MKSPFKIDPEYPTLMQSDLPLRLFFTGKVKDVYKYGDELLFVVTDRISTHDCVYPQGIPHKGYGLTQTAKYVFEKTRNICNNHFIESPDPNTMIVYKTNVFPVEVIVRGVLTGSAWRSYEKTGEVCGIKLPKGMKKNQILDSPIVTPTIKAKTGHDEAITSAKAREIVGPVWDEIEKLSLKLYEVGNLLVNERNAVLVDTKFEWGMKGKKLMLVDEALTHDSSRFVMREDYKKAFYEGKDPDWIDKQFVRNYVEGLGFRGDGEPPKLPEKIILGCAERVLMVYYLLSGEYLPLPEEPPTNERIIKNLMGWEITYQTKQL